MISAISLTLVTAVSIVVLVGLLCTGIIFCCCALSSFNVCSALLCCGGQYLFFSKRNRRYASHNGGGHTYQNRSFIDNAHSNDYVARAPMLVTDNDLLLAEAYLVAPFAEARLINDSSPSLDGVYSAGRTSEQSTLERGNDSEQSKYPQMVFKDTWATVIFVFQVFVIVYFAIEVLLASTKSIHATDVQTSGLGIVIVAFFILGTVATIAGATCLTLILRNAEHIIEGVMWVNIGVGAVGAILCLATLATNGFVFAIFFSALAAFNYCYLINVRPRIAFASAVLSVACKSIIDNYRGFITAAYLLLVVQLGWYLLWAIAAYGISAKFIIDANKNNNSNGDQTISGGKVCIIILLFLSLHWGSEVIRLLLMTTVNGVIGCWWFEPSRKAVVRGALFRSATTSFGSICFGSLIVSAIHALRDILNMTINKEDSNGRSRERGIVTEMASCILGLIEQAMTYVNKYAYCYVAGYGMGFIEAARKVSKLFADRGWTALVNDNLVGNALMFAVVGMTIVTSLFGALCSLFLGPPLSAVGIPDPLILFSLVGALMGFAVSIILTNALSSGVSMVFVCMAENPDALKANHPREFFSLTTAWSACHADIAWARNVNGFIGATPMGGVPYPSGTPYPSGGAPYGVVPAYPSSGTAYGGAATPYPNSAGFSGIAAPYHGAPYSSGAPYNGPQNGPYMGPYNGGGAAPYYGGGRPEGPLQKGGASTYANTVHDSHAHNPLHQPHQQQGMQYQQQQHGHQQQQYQQGQHIQYQQQQPHQHQQHQQQQQHQPHQPQYQAPHTHQEQYQPVLHTHQQAPHMQYQPVPPEQFTQGNVHQYGHQSIPHGYTDPASPPSAPPL